MIMSETVDTTPNAGKDRPTGATYRTQWGLRVLNDDQVREMQENYPDFPLERVDGDPVAGEGDPVTEESEQRANAEALSTTPITDDAGMVVADAPQTATGRKSTRRPSTED